MNKHYQIVIVGGGTAGIMVASRLLRQNPDLKGNIAIIDPAKYQLLSAVMDVSWCWGIKIKKFSKKHGECYTQRRSMDKTICVEF